MGVFAEAASLLRQLGPVGELPARAVELAGDSVSVTERAVWSFVRSRIDSVSPAVVPTPRELEPVRPKAAPRESPRQLMAQLLDDALEHDTLSGEREYLVATIGQLLPDEARILAALAAGVKAPTVSVYRRGTSDLLVENASLIGRNAAVTLPSRTPRYVAHLLQMGLVELGPEDKDDATGYELILADRDVRPALQAGARGKLPARVERTTLRISQHGRALWDATRPDVPEGRS
ncbi:MAG TPA: hypothetical protein VN088_11235 [Nocardioides sp.]|nr:hypothetical protein [Nocardioides sp.]